MAAWPRPRGPAGAPELSYRPLSPAETLSSSKLNKLFQSPISSFFFHLKPQATANCHTMNSVSPLINEEKTGGNLHLIRESSSFINYHFLANTSLSSCLLRSEIYFPGWQGLGSVQLYLMLQQFNIRSVTIWLEFPVFYYYYYYYWNVELKIIAFNVLF